MRSRIVLCLLFVCVACGGGGGTKTSAAGDCGKTADGLSLPKVGSYTEHFTGTAPPSPINPAAPTSFDRDATFKIAVKGNKVTRTTDPQQGQQGGGTTQTLCYGADGVHLQRSISGSGMAVQDIIYKPEQVTVKWPLEPGATWKGKWTSDQNTGTYEYTVKDKESVDALGESVEAWAIDAKTTLDRGGQTTTTATGTTWFAPSIGLEVKSATESETKSSRGNFSLHSERVLQKGP